MSYEYTLLIVESPILADRINQLKIPWLEVIPTNGFIWKPVYKADKQQLTAKADPDKRPLRKTIREKSGWAKKIVIATDSDPSGDFIAWSLINFLSDKLEILRTYIHEPGSDSVINQINQAFKPNSGKLIEQLELRYLLQQLWNNAFPDLTPQDTVLTGLLHDLSILNEFKDIDENYYVPSTYGHPESGPSNLIEAKRNGNNYYLSSPPSTFDLLQLAGLDTEKTFFDLSEKLFRLFTHRVDSEYVHLVSYPRTANNKFYPETWKDIEQNLVNGPHEKWLKPISVREIAAIDEAHESLRPVHLTANPQSVRSLLPRDLYDIYKAVYELFVKSTMVQEVPLYIDVKYNEICFLSVNTFTDIEKETVCLQNCATVGAIGFQLYQWGITQPSRFGKQLDNWIWRRYVNRNKIYLEPGPSLPAFDQNIQAAFDLWKRAQMMINQPDRDGLCQIFND